MSQSSDKATVDANCRHCGSRIVSFSMGVWMHDSYTNQKCYNRQTVAEPIKTEDTFDERCVSRHPSLPVTQCGQSKGHDGSHIDLAQMTTWDDKPTQVTEEDKKFAVLIQPYGDDWHVYAPFTKDAAEAMLERAANIESIETAYSCEIQTPDELEETISDFEREAEEYEAEHG